MWPFAFPMCSCLALIMLAAVLLGQGCLLAFVLPAESLLPFASLMLSAALAVLALSSSRRPAAAAMLHYFFPAVPAELSAGFPSAAFLFPKFCLEAILRFAELFSFFQELLFSARVMNVISAMLLFPVQRQHYAC